MKIEEVFLTIAAFVALYALVQRAHWTSVRWNLQAIVFLLMAVCAAALSGCADVKVVSPHAATGPQDARYVYDEMPKKSKHAGERSDEPIGIACEPDPTHRYPCRAPADAEFDQLTRLHTDWVASHTVTIPVGKCIAADMGTTAVGYLIGFHEGGIPIAFKAAVTWWQIQASAAAARQGDLSIAEITALTHCAGAAINVAKFVR